MRPLAFLVVAVAAILVGCAVTNGPTTSRTTGTREVVLVDADFSLTPAQTSMGWPYALPGGATASQLALRVSGPGVSGHLRFTAQVPAETGS